MSDYYIGFKFEADHADVVVQDSNGLTLADVSSRYDLTPDGQSALLQRLLPLIEGKRVLLGYQWSSETHPEAGWETVLHRLQESRYDVQVSRRYRHPRDEPADAESVASALRPAVNTFHYEDDVTTQAVGCLSLFAGGPNSRTYFREKEAERVQAGRIEEARSQDVWRLANALGYEYRCDPQALPETWKLDVPDIRYLYFLPWSITLPRLGLGDGIDFMWKTEDAVFFRLPEFAQAGGRQISRTAVAVYRSWMSLPRSLVLPDGNRYRGRSGWLTSEVRQFLLARPGWQIQTEPGWIVLIKLAVASQPLDEAFIQEAAAVFERVHPATPSA